MKVNFNLMRSARYFSLFSKKTFGFGIYLLRYSAYLLQTIHSNTRRVKKAIFNVSERIFYLREVFKKSHTKAVNLQQRFLVLEKRIKRKKKRLSIFIMN